MKTLIKLFIGLFLIVCSYYKVYSQSDISGPTGHNWSTGFYLGWASAHNLDFLIYGNQYIMMDGTTSGKFGYVGIGDASLGTNFTSFPNWRLDVDLGDINLNQTDATLSEAYRIGGYRVLWHNQNTFAFAKQKLRCSSRNSFLFHSLKS